MQLAWSLNCSESLADVLVQAAKHAKTSPSHEAPSCVSDVWVSYPRADTVVVELNGEHDIASKHALRSLLSDLLATCTLVVVDVTNAQFIDSSVLPKTSFARTSKQASQAAVSCSKSAPPHQST